MAKPIDVTKLFVCKACGVLVAEERAHRRWHDRNGE